MEVKKHKKVTYFGKIHTNSVLIKLHSKHPFAREKNGEKSRNSPKEKFRLLKKSGLNLLVYKRASKIKVKVDGKRNNMRFFRKRTQRTIRSRMHCTHTQARKNFHTLLIRSVFVKTSECLGKIRRRVRGLAVVGGRAHPGSPRSATCVRRQIFVFF